MNKNKFLNKNNLLIAPYTIWMIGFIIIPLFFILYYAFTNKSGQFTFSNLLSFFDFENGVHIKSFLLASKLSLISTIICIVLTYPLALILKNKKLNNKSFIIYIFILPMWMNSLFRIYAWATLLERRGVINAILSFFKLPNLYIINTQYAIVLGMVYNYLPFMILPIYNSIMKIDDNILDAAKDLGSNFYNTFVKIILPLSFPGMLSGITMVFIPALTTIVISNILGGGNILLIGNVIEQEFLMTSNWNLGSGLSFVLIIFIFITMALTNKYSDGSEVL